MSSTKKTSDEIGQQRIEDVGARLERSICRVFSCGID
jgi:hypothetical protein